jgi:hypothetical protein
MANCFNHYLLGSVMRKIIILSFALFAILSIVSAQQSRIKQLERKSQQYIEQGNYRKAIQTLEEADKIQRSSNAIQILTDDNIARASRFVKLAHTYINNGDYGKALENLERARKLIGNKRSWDARYWLAAIDEAYGTAYKKMKFYDIAQRYLNSALDQYKKLVSMREGSPEALRILIANLETELNDISNTNISNTTLNLDNQKLRTLPSQLPAFLENLSLSGNRFRDFPSELANFKNLKVINLANNSISDVKFDFGSLQQLKWLNLSNNKIKTLDETISKAQNLEYIDLSNNKLKALPVGISNLKNLKVLNLRNNKLPFSAIKNLLQAMPKTNIIHDEYIQKGESVEE